MRLVWLRSLRCARGLNYEMEGDGWVNVVVDVPARGLIGYMAGEFKNDAYGAGES